MNNRYELLSGEVVECEPPAGPLAAFLARVQTAADDPAVSPADLLALVYGVENPLLDTVSVAGRAIINAASLAHPLYRVFGDIVFRKQLAARGQTRDQVAATFTLTVGETAERLGLTPTAVRSAIQGGKLAAMKRNGEWYVHPNSVAGYKVSNRGRKKRAITEGEPAPAPPNAVRVRAGSANGASLSARVASGELIEEGRAGGAWLGRFPDAWTAAAVKTTTKSGVRVFELEPADEPGEITFEGFEVRGPFKVTRKHNNTTKAVAAWKGYAGTAAEA